MFVRFRHQGRHRLQASIVETTRRADGNVCQKHVAGLGSILVPPSVADRVAFWQQAHERLAKLDPIRDGPVIRHAGVLVADGGGEEFEEAAHRGVAGAGDRRRHVQAATPWVCCRGCPGPPNRDELIHVFCVT
jgi:hypothetical protein